MFSLTTDEFFFTKNKVLLNISVLSYTTFLMLKCFGRRNRLPPGWFYFWLESAFSGWLSEEGVEVDAELPEVFRFPGSLSNVTNA